MTTKTTYKLFLNPAQDMDQLALMPLDAPAPIDVIEFCVVAGTEVDFGGGYLEVPDADPDFNYVEISSEIRHQLPIPNGCDKRDGFECQEANGYECNRIEARDIYQYLIDNGFVTTPPTTPLCLCN